MGQQSPEFLLIYAEGILDLKNADAKEDSLGGSAGTVDRSQKFCRHFRSRRFLSTGVFSNFACEPWHDMADQQPDTQLPLGPPGAQLERMKSGSRLRMTVSSCDFVSTKKSLSGYYEEEDEEEREAKLQRSGSSLGPLSRHGEYSITRGPRGRGYKLIRSLITDSNRKIRISSSSRYERITFIEQEMHRIEIET